MPAAIAALLLSLGCASAPFTGPGGEFAVWVCPATEPPAEAAPPLPPPAPRPPGRDI
jgi:hypothetical protein